VLALQPHLAQIGMLDIRRAIDEHGLPVDVVQNNGQEMLVFDPDPSRRWILLKLLADDYLNSVMTHLKIRSELQDRSACGSALKPRCVL
jgi:SH3-like domain-containing protein